MIFKGRVQGVGFRYKSYLLANELGLTGDVNNLYDGDVELNIQ
ncbi:MAG: acylphosphatase, partial [Anaerococcus obesiensis]